MPDIIKVRMIGTSLRFTIPKPIARLYGIENGTKVELKVINDRSLMITVV